MDTNSVHKLADLLRSIRVAFLVTGDGSGGLHARPMYTLAVDPETFDGELDFFTDADAVKVHELESLPSVLITYADTAANRYVIVHGTARVDRDVARARKLWSIHAQAWWPEGPESPNLAVIRVRVQRAEYWDGPSSARYALSLGKALMTGTRIDPPSDHGSMVLG